MKYAIGVILVLFIVGCTQVEIPEEKYCKADEDCVPATCCHPNECVNSNNEPDCEGIMCTQECKPGTLDCGQGKCVCKNNECTAEIE